MSRPTLVRHPSENKDLGRSLNGDREDEVTITMEQPATNMFFQRDQQIVGDEGPILCQMYYENRRSETPIVRQAWEDIGADVSSPVRQEETIEGGEFIPAGDFALIGVESPQGDVLRTSYGAAEDILESGQLGYDEVGLVKAPKAKAEEMAEKYDSEADMDIMHLDTWFNIAAEGLAVMNENLAQEAEVDVFHREDGEYSISHTEDFVDYIKQQGYDWVDIPDKELPEGANFLTLDDGKVLAIYNSDENGDYDPEINQTIEGMKQQGVEVVPDGVGMDLENLTNGYGGAHCMTTPINRN
jgi:arginine deiminase